MVMSHDEFENWRETLEIMANPRPRRAIRDGLRDIRARRTRPLEDVLKGLGVWRWPRSDLSGRAESNLRRLPEIYLRAVAVALNVPRHASLGGKLLEGRVRGATLTQGGDVPDRVPLLAEGSARRGRQRRAPRRGVPSVTHAR